MDEVDYSDFAVQMVTLEPQMIPPLQQGANIKRVINIEPLKGRGGLSNNEVAELVYLETAAYIEPETELGDQDVASTTELRGVVGVNLPADRSGLPRGSTATLDEQADFYETQAVDDTAFQGGSITDNAYFQHFKTQGIIPFDDEAGGPGGGAVDHFHAEKYWRELTGRGPVLDQNDDVSVNSVLVADDSAVNVQGSITLTMHWDVAETDDAGRRFSVPR